MPREVQGLPESGVSFNSHLLHAARALAKATNDRNISWPSMGASPINEFTHEGYLIQDFPTLFSTEEADFLARNRTNKVGALEYFQHPWISRTRFALHSRFRYVAMNTAQRCSALNQGAFCGSNNSTLRDKTAEQLKEISAASPALAKQLMFFGSKLRGTRAYCCHSSGELIDL